MTTALALSFASATNKTALEALRSLEINPNADITHESARCIFWDEAAKAIPAVGQWASTGSSVVSVRTTSSEFNVSYLWFDGQMNASVCFHNLDFATIAAPFTSMRTNAEARRFFRRFWKEVAAMNRRPGVRLLN